MTKESIGMQMEISMKESGENKRHGNKTLYKHNEIRYEGGWKDDKMDGKGIRYYAEGSKYKGTRKNGKKHGKGILWHAKGGIRNEEWNDGIRTKDCTFF